MLGRIDLRYKVNQCKGGIKIDGLFRVVVCVGELTCVVGIVVDTLKIVYLIVDSILPSE